MKATLSPGSISGYVAAPSSKSMTQRAYAGALLHRGQTIIHNAGNSDDERAAFQIIQQLGARVTNEGCRTIVSSNGIKPVTNEINCGESGLSARLFMPVAALSTNTITVRGTGSLLHRPMTGINEVMTSLNVSVSDFNGYLPITLGGPLHAGNITVNAEDGSQLLSGLLFALCDAARAPLTVNVLGLKSKPYIDMTISVLADFGRKITHDNYERFFIDPSSFTQKETIELTVEADWSSAACFLVGGAIAGEVTLGNLNMNSKQADRVIVDILRTVGAAVSVENDGISVKKSRLKAFEFDATDCPDLFPILSILAASCEGESYITGVHRLFNKESNRAESITEMLQDFNVPFSIEDDMLCISGVRYLQGTIIDSYHDHRIVMAAAIGGFRANGPVEILHAGSVNKSYPDFFKDLSLCGGKYELI